jgi:glutaredoxin
MILYTMNNCSKCLEIKNILNNKKIKFEEKDIYDDAEMLEKLQVNNILAMPVIESHNILYAGSDIYDFIEVIEDDKA